MCTLEKIKKKKKKMYAVLALIVIVVFLIIVAVFASGCCPAKCCVFDPACCTNACDRRLCNKSFIPFYGPTFNLVDGDAVNGPVLLGPTQYVGFVQGSSTGLALQSDLTTNAGVAAAFASPFTSSGKVQDLEAWITASVAAGTSTVTVALYVAPQSGSASTPSFASVLSTTFTVTTSETTQFSSTVGLSGANATVSAGDLYIVLVTASAATTLVGAGGGFNYLL